MNFSIAAITARLLSPQHELSCSWLTWFKLVAALRERGHGRRESGAFLLGHRIGQRRRVIDFALYDDLDPHCLDEGFVRFDGRHFGKLWDICQRQGMAVVADVHTHPGGEQQSTSDRANPMIAQTGHLALILPRFAAGPLPRSDIGIYRYLGARSWETIPQARRRAFFHLGL